MNPKIFLILFCGFVLMILINVLIYNLIVRRALKQIIRPYLKTLGYSVEKVSFPGLLSTGDFENSGFQIRPVPVAGNIVNSTYSYLFVKGINGKVVRITAKIKTVFLSIRKVEYSKSLPNLIK